MSRNPSCTVYIGNLDEKVNDRVLYEILIQVGRIVDLHILRDKETSRPKGYAFAEYETEEIANYAVRLFSGLVRLYNKTLKFAISGQDKLSQNSLTSVAPQLNSPIPMAQSLNLRASEIPQESTPSMPNCRTSSYTNSGLSSFSQASPSPNGFLNKGLISSNFEYSRRMFGSMLNTVNRSDSRQTVDYSSY